MLVTMLKSKIHRATVTDSCLDYEGSLTIDETLMKAANILPYEKIAIYNIKNGNRFETYAITGEADSGIICVNGAAAHLASEGELIIIAAYAQMDFDEAKNFKPEVVKVNENNKMKK